MCFEIESKWFLERMVVISSHPTKVCFVRCSTWKMSFTEESARKASIVILLAGTSASTSKGSVKRQRDENFKRIK